MKHKIRPKSILAYTPSIRAIAGIAGPCLLIATDVAAGLSQPGYNLIEDSISSLALTQMGWIQTIGFLAIGLLVEVFVTGLLLGIRGGWDFAAGIFGLACFGFGLLLIGAFHTDPVGAAQTRDGAIHGMAATTVFWLFPVSVALLSASLKSEPYWKSLYRYTLVTFGVAVGLLVLRFFLPDPLSWFGLYERLLVGNSIIWVLVMALRLYRLSRRQQRFAREPRPVPEPSPTLLSD